MKSKTTLRVIASALALMLLFAAIPFAALAEGTYPLFKTAANSIADSIDESAKDHAGLPAGNAASDAANYPVKTPEGYNEHDRYALNASGIGLGTTYDYNAAAQYGYDHAYDTPTYSGGDCANFTSQCLAAGGITVINSSTYYSASTYSYQNCSGTLGAYRNPYIASAAQLLYLSEFYEVIASPSYSQIELGDIVFMRSTSTSSPDTHVVIITGFNGSTPLFSGHTKARQNYPLGSGVATYVVKMRRPKTSGAPSIPEAPQNVRTDKSLYSCNEYITFYWDASAGATDYYVYMWKDGIQLYAHDVGTNLSFTSAPTSAGNYWLIVRAGNSAGYSDGPAVVYFTVYDSIPEAPQNVRTDKSLYSCNEYITFYWDASAVATDYYVYLWKDGIELYAHDVGTNLSFTSAPTSAGNYWLIVTAGNGIGYSDGPAVVYFTVYDSIPETPVVATDKQQYICGEPVVVSWSGVANTEFYWFEIYNEDGLLIDERFDDTTTTSYTVNNLPAGSYKAYVFPNNAFGFSTGECNFTVYDSIPEIPVVTTDKQQYICGEPVVVSWSDVANTEFYWFEIYNEDGLLLIDERFDDTTTTSYTVNDLPAGSYKAYVFPNNAFGFSTGECNFTVYDSIQDIPTPTPAATPTSNPTSSPIPSNAPKIIVESKTAYAGSTVTLSISIANNPGLVTMGLQVAYDPHLTLLSFEDTGLLPGQMHSPELVNPMPLYWANPTANENYTVNGTILTMTFQVPEGLEPGEYPIAVIYDYDNYDIYDYYGEAVEFAVVNGAINITDIVYGDVNGDGRVNNLDGMVLMRYLAKWPSYPASMISLGADVNADGRINNLDGMILMRHLAKWPSYAALPCSNPKNCILPTSLDGIDVNEDEIPYEGMIIAGNAEANPGDMVSINIDLADNPGLATMSIYVEYDPRLTLIGIEDTGLLPGQMHSPVLTNPMPLTWANPIATGNYTVNGTILTMTFQIPEDAEPGEYKIILTYDYENYDIYDYNGEAVKLEPIGGVITVGGGQTEMYTVTFVDFDGTILSRQNVEYGSAATAPLTPERTGYTFTGWDVDFTNVTEDITVTAQYSVNSYTITYTINGEEYATQTYEYGAAVSAPEYTVLEGHTFSGWEIPETMPAENLVLDATLTVNSYTIIYTINGEEYATQTYEYGAAVSAPSYEVPAHFVFSGWDTPETMPAGDIELNATLIEEGKYTVTFVVDDETYFTFTGYEGDVIAIPEVPEKLGHTFVAWDGMPEGSVLPAANITVTAVWDINTYTITYTVNGEEFTVQTYEYGTAITAPEYAVPEGYTFSGWNVPETMPAENLVVDAICTINVYEVTLIDSVTGETIAVLNVEHGQDAVLPDAPDHIGYIFDHWNGNSTNVTENRTITALYWMIGDANHDGEITACDALLIMRYALGLETDGNELVMDFNGDGRVDSIDALLVLRRSIGIA